MRIDSCGETRVTIYVLECENGKYYVGKSRNYISRLGDHFAEQNRLEKTWSWFRGAQWTKTYPPVNVHAVFKDCDEYDEDKYTKIMMAKFGIENVRGGSYVTMQLPDETLDLLQKEIRGSENRCFSCGAPGHFVKGCPELQDQARRMTNSTVEPCYRCGRQGHWIAECFAKTHLSGMPLPNSSTSSESHPPAQVVTAEVSTSKQSMPCFRCGREGHLVSACYATTDTHGRSLSVAAAGLPNQPFARATSSKARICQSTQTTTTAKSSSSCSRCGRQSHQSSQCYAKTTVIPNRSNKQPKRPARTSTSHSTKASKTGYKHSYKPTAKIASPSHKAKFARSAK